MFSKPIDFLAIGDTVTDAFIRLKEAHVNCNIKDDTCEICMKFGDKIPFESATVVKAVGNSANASVSAKRLGLNPALLSNLGDDDNGKECLETLKENGINTKYISVHKGMLTNYHYVLWYGSERTILVKHQEYPYKLPRFNKNPKWVYISSLASNSYEYHLEIANWLKENPLIKVALQPGTFQMSLGYEKLKPLYERSDVFFCNKEEAQKILETDESEIKKLMELMHAKGPKTVVITDGPKGAYAFDGKDYYFMPIYPDPKPPLDRTGAGDAFASTFTIALIKGKSIEEALTWAPINSASVVQEIGAQKGLLSEEEMKKWLSIAPEDYKVKRI